MFFGQRFQIHRSTILPEDFAIGSFHRKIMIFEFVDEIIRMLLSCFVCKLLGQRNTIKLKRFIE